MKFNSKYKFDVKDGVNEQQTATNTATRLMHENTENQFDTFYTYFLIRFHYKLRGYYIKTCG